MCLRGFTKNLTCTTNLPVTFELDIMDSYKLFKCTLLPVELMSSAQMYREPERFLQVVVAWVLKVKTTGYTLRLRHRIHTLVQHEQCNITSRGKGEHATEMICMIIIIKFYYLLHFMYQDDEVITVYRSIKGWRCWLPEETDPRCIAHSG